MVKHFDTTYFKCGRGDKSFVAECYSTNTKNGFCHTAKVYGQTDTKVSYLNRTWESFTFETVLKCAIDKYNKVHGTHFTIKSAKVCR